MHAHYSKQFENCLDEKRPYDKLARLISQGFNTELFDSGRYESGKGWVHTFNPSAIQQLYSNEIKATSQHCLKPIQYENRAGLIDTCSVCNFVCKTAPIKKETRYAKRI